MTPFEYRRPASLVQALALMAAGGEPRYLAGGQSLLAALKLRLAQPDSLIDITRIPELAGIRAEDGWLVVGAATTHAQLARQTTIPALAELSGSIADLQIRNMGTVGGSLANNDPASDHGAAALGLGAVIRTDRRAIAADEFFVGMFETALEPDELIIDIRYPVAKRAGYAKLRNPASGYPVVGVFVAETESGIRVAVTGAKDCVFRATDMEEALSADFTPDAVKSLVVPDHDLNRDLHATAQYRAHLIPVMAARAVDLCR